MSLRVALLAALALCVGCAGQPSPPMTTPASSPSEPAAASPASSASSPPIVQTGAPVLRSRAAEVPPERIPTAEFQALIATMTAAMRQAPGVGLAAPQIGIPWRVIVLEDRDDLIARLTPEERQERERAPFPLRVFVNPVLRAIGDEKRTFFEGCLSVKGFAALVERSAEVEVDHLDGTLYLDRMMTRSFSTMEQSKALYGGKPIAEIRRLLGL